MQDICKFSSTIFCNNLISGAPPLGEWVSDWLFFYLAIQSAHIEAYHGIFIVCVGEGQKGVGLFGFGLVMDPIVPKSIHMFMRKDR